MLSQRLKAARESLGKSQKELAAAIGSSHRAWHAYEAGENVPGGAVLASLAALGFDGHWLLTGEGPMRRNSASGGSPAVSDSGTAWACGGAACVSEGTEGSYPAPPREFHEGWVVVPWIRSVRVGAEGNPEVATSTEGSCGFRVEWLRSLGQPESLLLLQVAGDAMEPTLRGGDAVLVDTRSDRIAGDGLYAVAAAEGVLVRRLQPLVGSRIRVICDNRKLYESFEADSSRDSLPVIGKVVWFARRLATPGSFAPEPPAPVPGPRGTGAGSGSCSR